MNHIKQYKVFESDIHIYTKYLDEVRDTLVDLKDSGFKIHVSTLLKGIYVQILSYNLFNPKDIEDKLEFLFSYLSDLGLNQYNCEYRKSSGLGSILTTSDMLPDALTRDITICFYKD